MNSYITSARVMTRDGYHLNPLSLVQERHEASERRQMLATVARMEARLELMRAAKCGAVNPDAPVISTIVDLAGPRTGSHPMATRNEPQPSRPQATRIRPALIDRDLEDFGETDRLLKTAVRVLAVASVVMALVAALKVAPWL